MKKRVYLDYAASTPIDPRVGAAMRPYFFREFGNAGSLHSFGQKAIAAVDKAREDIARPLGAEFRQVIFTGSATEGNNIALRGAVKKWKESRGVSRTLPRIIISAIEHDSVHETARDLAREGADLIIIPVTREGLLDVRTLENSLSPETAVVSVMYASNEIGAIQPIREIGDAIAAYRMAHGDSPYPLFHADAAQAFQFLPCDVRDLGVDLLTLSAHKIYGPKGIGALYVRDHTMLAPVFSGGGQEFGLRPGTENVPLIAGFGKAVSLAEERREKMGKRMHAMATRLMQRLGRSLPDVRRHGPEHERERLPHIVHLHIPGKKTDEIITLLDLRGFAVSAGSACKARSVVPSRALEAMGIGAKEAGESIRVSFGAPTSASEIDAFARELLRTRRVD